MSAPLLAFLHCRFVLRCIDAIGALGQGFVRVASQSVAGCGQDVSIEGVLGDQQAALFGQVAYTHERTHAQMYARKCAHMCVWVGGWVRACMDVAHNAVFEKVSCSGNTG